MRTHFILISFFSFTLGFSQNKLPIVKSNTKQVKIVENKELVTEWNLVSEAKPDTYISGKNTKSRNIKIVTDIDSLEINLKPKQEFDFIVLLNDKDSCYTRFKSLEAKNFSNEKPSKKTTIPFVLSVDNNIQTEAILNKKDSVKLLFDTGATGFYLKKTAIKQFLNPEGKKITMKDISDNHFKISDLEWNHQQVYPLETTGDCCGGMYGWDIFDGKIVEIDYDTNLMTVHTKSPKIPKDYEKFEMEIMKEHFCINVDIEVDNKRYKSRFLFDTGYQKSVMLDNKLMNKTGVPVDKLPLIKKSVMYNSQNQEIPVSVVSADKLIFGKYILENIPAQINSNSQPAGYATNFLGGEVLKRFNIILDFQNNLVYLKPNHLFKEPYGDNIKS
ncbi:aspartyl protease family protein [Epilithonimonas zeae]|uniref:aspartyl protease family protein n=1 Tax=Epilithonimonas zeae TaxID=1416779 RepID=UPI00200C1E61|nr:aspartyl protease family protein [Epilithonimonas zeae]UQB69197.1 aspartyl protease family protein [Epilithonimonas zeae]